MVAPAALSTSVRRSLNNNNGANLYFYWSQLLRFFVDLPSTPKHNFKKSWTRVSISLLFLLVLSYCSHCLFCLFFLLPSKKKISFHILSHAFFFSFLFFFFSVFFPPSFIFKHIHRRWSPTTRNRRIWSILCYNGTKSKMSDNIKSISYWMYVWFSVQQQEAIVCRVPCIEGVVF